MYVRLSTIFLLSLVCLPALYGSSLPLTQIGKWGQEMRTFFFFTKDRSNQLDPRGVPGRRRQPPVARQQRRVKRLRQRHVGGVVRRQVIPELKGSDPLLSQRLLPDVL